MKPARHKGARALLLTACLSLLGGVGGQPGLAQTPPPAASLLTRLSRQGPVTLMPLGDSLTFGYTDPRLDGYRLQLWNDLTAAGYTIQYRGSVSNGDLPDTRNEGHPGYRIDQIATGADGWLKNTQPEIILLLIGTNDVVLADHLAGAPDRLSALIDQILRDDPQVHLLVASIPPILWTNGVPWQDRDYGALVPAYNAVIPHIVQAKAAAGMPVCYVEMHDALTPADLVDGIHPLPEGYAKMGDIWFRALQKL